MVGRRTPRARRAITRLDAARSRFRSTRGPMRVLTVLACVVAGFMMATSALASRGNDLRPDRTTEFSRLVAQEADRADDLAREAATLRAQIDDLTRASATRSDPDAAALTAAAEVAAAVGVLGPAVSVTLTDAPASVQPAGVDADLLVVHQQDIQAVANALWRGGAEAMTIQGQRVSSRTGIKCVGNTVVLHGVPYAPPYVITAIGDQGQLERALADSDYLRIYRQYVDTYRLGYAVARTSEVTMPAYQGPAEFTHARVAR
ncbi:MAG: DUF881 domain-containing protein [Propionibacteriaceae bacterium]|nr:DUF881 domain-containing protein [Propionibacteriaceae bacterium]